jgi:hypothetical protein
VGIRSESSIRIISKKTSESSPLVVLPEVSTEHRGRKTVAGYGEKLFLSVGIASALSFIMLAEKGDPEWSEKYGRYVLEELPGGNSSEFLRQHPEFSTLGEDVRRWIDEGIGFERIVEKIEKKFGRHVAVKM